MSGFRTHSADGSRQGRGAGLVLLAYCAVCAALILPMLLHPHLPMIDLPNHMARRHIAANLSQDANLAKYYAYSFRLVPNVAVDALYGILGLRGDVYLFSRFLVTVYAANFVFSVLALSRVATGQWRFWPLASALVVYNACLYWGFENYLFSAPFAIHGLTLWLLLASRPTWLRLLVFTPVSLLIFFGHFFAFVAFAAMVIGRELQVLLEAQGNQRLRAFLRNAPLALPFVLPVIWLLFQPAAGGTAQGNRTEFGGLDARIEAALSPTTIWPFVSPGSVEGIFETMVLVFLAAILLFALRKGQPKLEAAPVLKGSILALALISVAAPAWLNGVAFVQLRFPFLLVALVIAATRWRGLPSRHAALLGLLVTALIVGRVAVFNAAAARYSNSVDDLVQVLRSLPEGARLLPLAGQGSDPAFSRGYHYPGFAVVERNVLVPTLFQGVHTLTINPEWVDYTHPWFAPLDYALLLPQNRAAFEEMARGPYVLDRAYWLNWENKFTHILAPSQTVVDLADVLPVIPLSSRGAFTLFAICPQSCP